jgi:crotonobetaine/carnitine-CoA ligase
MKALASLARDAEGGAVRAGGGASPVWASPAPLARRTTGHLLREAARDHGERPFLEWRGVIYSYAEADRRANHVANAFRALGVGKGTRVAILCTNRVEYLDLWFGLSKIGAIELPLNTAYKGPQLLHSFVRAEVPVAVVQADLAAEFEAIAGELTACRHVVWLDGPVKGPAGAAVHAYESLVAAASDDERGDIAVTGADIGAIMNTSGTTGPSKGVLLPQAQQYWLGRNIAAALELGPDDVYYNFFPLFHNTAQAMITLPVLMSGGRMVLTEKFSLSSFWSDVRRHGITTFYYIGEILHLLVKEGGGPEAGASTLRAGWGIGGAPADVAEFERRHGVLLGTGYGSTEANVPVFRPLGSDPTSASAGRVLPEFDVRIADSAGHPLPTGSVGEVLVCSREPFALMAGYDGNPAASAEALAGGWLRTGDAGRFDEAGNFYFCSRIKDVIRVRGENVSAFEIEEVILGLPGVVEAAAIAVPAEIGGDDVMVVVVPAPGAALDPADLVAACERRLPKFCVPRYIEFRAALPKTETNKIRKNVLRDDGVGPSTWDRLSKA